MKLNVILPVYNAEQYLEECLDSLLNQTFKDFMVFAVNDASSDNSGKILDRYAQKDARLKVFHFLQNSGDSAATQFALTAAYQTDAIYTARMDADDICLPDRFQKQIDYLDQHRDIDVLGGQTQNINGTNSYVTSVPLSDDKIKFQLVLACANLLNPTVMWRNSTVAPLNIPYCQTKTASDYAMWVSLAIHRCKFANLPDILVKYRIHQNQASRKVAEITQSAMVSLTRYLGVLFSELDEKEIAALAAISPVGEVCLSIEAYQQAVSAYHNVKKRTHSVLGEDRQALIALYDERIAKIQALLASNS